jgi:hypothetical protein
MGEIIQLRRKLYDAKFFSTNTVDGCFAVAGTLCGCIDFAVPQGKTYSLTPDEALTLINMLRQSRHDVLENSDPYGDPRIVEK